MKILNKKIDNRAINEGTDNFLEFEKCTFTRCYLGNFINSIKEKFDICNVTLKSCNVDIIHTIGAVNFKNITVEKLKTKRKLVFSNSLFEHCKLIGNVGSIQISDYADLTNLQNPFNSEVLKYNTEKYKNIDWALDISEAQFVDFSCRGIPAEKIIINDDFQFKVNYQKLNEFPNHSKRFEHLISIYLDAYKFSKNNFVITTNKGNKLFQEDMDFKNYLIDIGCIFK